MYPRINILFIIFYCLELLEGDLAAIETFVNWQYTARQSVGGTVVVPLNLGNHQAKLKSKLGV